MHLRLRPIKNTNKKYHKYTDIQHTAKIPKKSFVKFAVTIFRCYYCCCYMFALQQKTKKKKLKKKPKKKYHTPHTLFLPRVRACLPACVCVRSYRVYAIYAFVSDQPRDALTLSYASNLYWPMASRRAWPHSHPVAPRPMLLKLPTIRIMAAPVAPTCRHI